VQENGHSKEILELAKLRATFRGWVFSRRPDGWFARRVRDNRFSGCVTEVSTREPDVLAELLEEIARLDKRFAARAADDEAAR
jgi:transposase